MTSVSKILHNLGGVYRDTIRVSSEANKLLNTSNGRHLRPNHSSLMENNGTFHSKLLVFQGTITITFRGGKYNIPVDIFLPPNYPVHPPICFVRPTQNMMIKENHRHVGRDGMVFMPYLHQWRNGSHSLTGMVSAMLTLFGNDPPVFSKPRTSTTSTAFTPNGRPIPLPSLGNTQPVVSSSFTNTSPYDDMQAAIEESKRIEEERLAQQQMENQKIEQARRESLQQAQEERSVQETRQKLTRKLQADVKAFYDKEKMEIINEFKEQKTLQKGNELVQNEVKQLEKNREELIRVNKEVDESNAQLKRWIDDMKSKQKEIQQNDDIDSLVDAADVQSRQMIDLSCEFAAISDCLYFLDRALVKGTISLDVHLKQVRSLAKRQFLVKAHLLKIVEIRARTEFVG